MCASVCLSFIMFKSYSALILNAFITWSNICLCCAVKHTTVSIFSFSLNFKISGHILMASGLVPNTTITFILSFFSVCLLSATTVFLFFPPAIYTIISLTLLDPITERIAKIATNIRIFQMLLSSIITARIPSNAVTPYKTITACLCDNPASISLWCICPLSACIID